jgi:hypothetical protein
MSLQIEIENREHETRTERENFGDMRKMNGRDRSGKRRASELHMGRRKSGAIKTRREALTRSTVVGLLMSRRILRMITELQDQRRRRDRRDIGWRRRLGCEMRKLELKLHGTLLEKRRRVEEHRSRQNGMIIRNMRHNTCKLRAEKQLQQLKSSTRDRCKERKRSLGQKRSTTSDTLHLLSQQRHSSPAMMIHLDDRPRLELQGEHRKHHLRLVARTPQNLRVRRRSGRKSVRKKRRSQHGHDQQIRISSNLLHHRRRNRSLLFTLTPQHHPSFPDFLRERNLVGRRQSILAAKKPEFHLFHEQQRSNPEIEHQTELQHGAVA